MVLFSAYRRDDFADPDGFLAQLNIVLEGYPDAIISEITSPRTGLQRRVKFPPTIAEVVEACDGEIARREKISRYAAMGELRREPRPPRHRANLFVRCGAPGYDAMVAMARAGDVEDFRYDADRGGMWVPLGLYETNKGRSVASFKQYTAEELASLYGRDPKATKPTGAATRAVEEKEWHDYLDSRETVA